LVDRGLLNWSSAPQGQKTLRFSHALVRDVAYERELKARRAAIHRAAAEWYAVLPVAQVLEEQARHLEWAVLLGESDCELVVRAVQAMVLHARSIEEERTRAAHQVLERAHALVANRPECPIDRLSLLRSWARVLEISGEVEAASRAVQEALALTAFTDNPTAVAECLLMQARLLAPLDPRLEEAHASADRAFEALGDLGGQAKVEADRSRAIEDSGGMPRAIAPLERAYDLAVRAGDVRLQATVAQELAIRHAICTGVPAFEVWAKRARDLSRADDVVLEPRLDVAQAILAHFGLDPAAGLESATRALQASRELGLHIVRQNAALARASLLVLDGQLQEAAAALPELNEIAATKLSDAVKLQSRLVEARLRQRQGRTAEALALLAAVGKHELLVHPVLQRDLAEAQAWVALDRGHFADARHHAAQAVLLDDAMGDQCGTLRSRLAHIVSATVQRSALPLADISTLRKLVRGTGLVVIGELATRWQLVDDLLHGWPIDRQLISPRPDNIECRALDAEIEALASSDWSKLLEAADIWAELGVTVWQARALLWHAEVTGGQSTDAHERLELLGAPPDLAETFRSQVRELVS
jgi:tetratricopeptide (TPR) repeat protein